MEKTSKQYKSSQKKFKNETFILIMPAFNEEKNIKATISSWLPVINKHNGSEILVINDGSKDATAKILSGLSKKNRLIKIVNKQNEGHGKTIFHGYKYAVASRHEWVFQTDSDGHFEPKDFYKLWRKRRSSDFIIGHRYKRKDPKYRILLTNIISIWILMLFGKHIKDPNIPFRLIKKRYLKELLKIIPENSFAPNIFLSILATRDGHNLHHIPVQHRSRKKDGHNKGRLFKGALKGFIELIWFALFVA